ncbi:MAG: antitoxin Xre/MbcA/ParS toxin-binding domain-containing protein [Candidatus Berkiella sp.]
MQVNEKSVTATKVLNKAVKNAALYLNLTQVELSKIVGSSTPQLSRLFNNDTICIKENSKEWECAVLFIRVFRSLESIIGEDPKQLKEWLYSFNHYFGEAPIEKLKTIQGLTEVVQYLDAMRGRG